MATDETITPKVSFSAEPIDRSRVDALVIPVLEGEKHDRGPAFAALDRALDGWLNELVQDQGFRAKACCVLSVPAPGGSTAKRYVLVGLGPAAKVDTSVIRRAHAKAVRYLAPGGQSVAIPLPGPEGSQWLGAAIEGLALGSYSFTKYRGASDDPPAEVRRILVHTSRRDETFDRAVREAQVLSSATCWARDLVNEPPGSMTPAHIAAQARRLERRPGLKVRVFGRRELERRAMGGILGVAAGSDAEPKLIHVDYRPSGRISKSIALVGKGVTFDSGGLSLKPAASMMTMKCDMAGAAAVLAAVHAASQLKLPIRVHAIVPAAENLPGPRATKPGDVLTISNGKTVEVLNTDAEGRLLLADALTYADSLRVDEVVDLATLTGACVIALGNDVAAVYSRPPELAAALRRAGEAEGEPLWEMPLVEAYKKELKSEVADLKNIGGRYAGSITAALFLAEFVKNERWAHLDIAGPAFAESLPELGPKGGTGFAVRTLVRYLIGLTDPGPSS
ncbi:MAG: leucyl aminopeptidase [Deltaproteobacteria bacterium]|nr:leucyl aminopeptidase [Deltaproteobacteria bacterium]